MTQQMNQTPGWLQHEVFESVFTELYGHVITYVGLWIHDVCIYARICVCVFIYVCIYLFVCLTYISPLQHNACVNLLADQKADKGQHSPLSTYSKVTF